MIVSVCIATYNGGKFIKTQLESILPQLSEQDEVIVSDDRSTDDTRAVIASLKDPRIRIVDGPAKGSPIPNFENALRHAKGDYIFLSDQDDRWMPDKLKTVMEVLLSGTDCVTTDCVVTDERFNVLKPSFLAANGARDGRWFNLLVRNNYTGGCMAFSRRVKEAALPFPADIPMHDSWIGNVAAFRFSHRFLHQPLSYFRRSGHTASTAGAASRNSLIKKLSIRWAVIKALIKRK